MSRSDLSWGLFVIVGGLLFSWLMGMDTHAHMVKCQYELIEAHSRPDSLRVAIEKHCEEAIP